MSLDKRYQVFVSSTFLDLESEREAILRALLKGNFIPAGMEVWPADTRPPLEVIYAEIDRSDFYVVVVGGRYGSTNDEHDGKSYTQLEYEYACSKGLDIVVLLHGSPGDIPSKHVDTDPELKAKLEEFRKVLGKHKFDTWKNAEGLREALLTSLLKMSARTTATGWVRADRLASEEVLSKLVEIQAENEKLRKRLAAGQPIQGIAGLGEMHTLRGTWHMPNTEPEVPWSLEAKWGQLFAYLAAFVETTSSEQFILDSFEAVLNEIVAIPEHAIPSLDPVTWEELLTQFRAHGLLQTKTNPQGREVFLTPRGERTMLNIKAIRSNLGDATHG